MAVLIGDEMTHKIEKKIAKKREKRMSTMDMMDNALPGEVAREMTIFDDIQIDDEGDEYASVSLTRIYADVTLKGNDEVLRHVLRGVIATLVVTTKKTRTTGYGKALHNPIDIFADWKKKKHLFHTKYLRAGYKLAIERAMTNIAMMMGLERDRPERKNYVKEEDYIKDVVRWKEEHKESRARWKWQTSKIWKSIYPDRRKMISFSAKRYMPPIVVPPKQEEQQQQQPQQENKNEEKNSQDTRTDNVSPTNAKVTSVKLDTMIEFVLKRSETPLELGRIVDGCKAMGWRPNTDDPLTEIRIAVSGMSRTVLRVNPENQGGAYTYMMRKPFVYPGKKNRRRNKGPREEIKPSLPTDA